MRAYHLDGSTELRLVEQADPAPGAGEVLVDLQAATLNYRDTIVRDGQYGSMQRADLIPLSDGAGVIVAVGEGVSPDRIGERVAIGFMPRWAEGPFRGDRSEGALGGGMVQGVLAEQIVVPATGVARIPDDWSFVEGAAYPCAGVTAWNCLFGGRGIRAGDTVLVQGTGGVSTFALQFAVTVGARVIVTSSSDAKIAQAQALGAEVGINYRTHANWGEAAAAIAGGEGVDHVVEVGGSATLNQSLAAVRPGGEVALVGVLTGFRGDVNTSAVVMKAITLRGVYVGSVHDLSTSLRSNVRPVIDDVFPFDAADAAYARLSSGLHRGKVAIKIAD